MDGAELMFKRLEKLLSKRVYPDVIPEINQNQWPAAVYTLISSVPENRQDYGFAGTEVSRYVLDVYAQSRTELREMQPQIIAALCQQTDLECLYEGRRDMYDSEVRRFRMSLEFSIREEMS